MLRMDSGSSVILIDEDDCDKSSCLVETGDWIWTCMVVMLWPASAQVVDSFNVKSS